jgi:hypothetical protein
MMLPQNSNHFRMAKIGKGQQEKQAENTHRASDKKPGDSTSTELARLNIEQQKLSIEILKLKIEKRKLFWSTLLGIVPMLAVIATIFYGIWTQQQQEKTQFRLKAAEFIFNSENVEEGIAKAEALKKIFPKALTEDFSKAIDSTNIDRFFTRLEISSKKELLRLLAMKAQTKEEIITNWKKIFPLDTWPDSLLAR